MHIEEINTRNTSKNSINIKEFTQILRQNKLKEKRKK